MHSLSYLIVVLLTVVHLGGCKEPPRNDGNVLAERTVESTGRTKIVGEIWVDNWFSLAVNGAALIEDSVPFKTERSFNAERVTFNADFPLTLAFEFRYFIQNDTGLEYIGSHRQQMGDGGAIAQFTLAETGAVIKVTDSSWRCHVIQHAPIDPACAREREPSIGQGKCQAKISQPPAGWKAPGFDDSSWRPATEHSTSEVGPKGGYVEISWKQAARLIWGEDLKRDKNQMILCVHLCDGIVAGWY